MGPRAPDTTICAAPSRRTRARPRRSGARRPDRLRDREASGRGVHPRSLRCGRSGRVARRLGRSRVHARATAVPSAGPEIQARLDSSGAARRGGDREPLELPARTPVDSGRNRRRRRERRRAQAVRADSSDRSQDRGDLPARRRAAEPRPSRPGSGCDRRRRVRSRIGTSMRSSSRARPRSAGR